MKKAFSVILLLLIFAAALSSCGIGSAERYSKSDVTVFDTQTVILGYDVSEAAFEKKADAVLEELRRLHKLYDIYYEYEGVSNLKTVNDMAGKAPVAVDDDIIELIKYCKYIYEVSDGYTNVAMGSVLRLWHECRSDAVEDPSGASLPSMDALRAAAEHTDINNVIIDEAASTVYLADGEMSLDVGAVAKGYAAERAAEFIKNQGWDNMALSVGGNIRTVGVKPDGKMWEMGVQNPDLDSENAYFCKVSADGETAIVTSGSYQRYFTIDGVRYHHIIDPVTLMPENKYLSVTVMCSDSGLGDGLSTALFNMDESRGREILSALGADGAWVYADGSVSYTDGFKAKLLEES